MENIFEILMKDTLIFCKKLKITISHIMYFGIIKFEKLFFYTKILKTLTSKILNNYYIFI